MSKYYWNEYQKLLIDNYFLNKCLSFHQMTVPKWTDMEDINRRAKLLNATEYIVSDVYASAIDIEELDEVVQSIVNIINRLYNQLEYVTSFPMLSIIDHKDKILRTYSIDITGKRILETRICEIKDCGLEILSQEIIVSFFININRAVALYKGRGYRKGIEEIGYISKCFQELLKRNAEPVMIPEQQFARAIGINVHQALFIDAIVI